MQRNWIGKSNGVTLSFDISEFMPNVKLETFTTRIDTVFSVTFIVLAPDIPLVKNIVQSAYEIDDNEYIKNENICIKR